MPALAACQGFALSLGLLAAVGPQNAHVLASGVQRAHVGTVVAICIAADVLLIGAGALGLGAWLAHAPVAAAALQAVAVAFLLRTARRAWRDARAATTLAEAGSAQPARRAVIATTLVVTFANPSVYLETLLLLGGASAAFDGAARVAFAAGAIGASTMWFGALGWGGRRLARWFARPATWRALNAASAVLMLHLALQLIFAAVPQTAHWHAAARSLFS